MEEFSKSYDCVSDQLWMTSVAMATALKSSVAVRKSDMSHSEGNSKKNVVYYL